MGLTVVARGRTLRLGVFGHGPGEPVAARAAELLATGDAPVTDVCFASGFGSVARFQTAFKRAWGMPPSEYRAAALSAQR
ncbi:MAG TPA: helix-turn-helix domain-containing protein [Streptosporangiaceae bacterium]